VTFGTTLALLVSAVVAQQGPKAPPPKVQDSKVPPPLVLPAPTDETAAYVNAPLTAEEAARIALKLQPNIRAAEGQVLAARGRVTQFGSALNPQVGVYAGYDQLNSIAGSGFTPPEEPTVGGVAGLPSVFRYSSAVQARQLIYDFNQTRNLVNQNEELESVAEFSLVQAQKDLVYQVKNAFYTYANAANLVKVDEQDVANRQRQLDLANARMRHEIGLPSDVVVAESSKSQAIFALNLARDQAEQAREALLNLMGVDPNTPVVAADQQEVPLASTDPLGLVGEALKLRPEIKAAERNLSATKYGLSAAKALGLPSLYAEAALGAAGNNFPLKDNSSSIGLGIQFSLYDGGARRGAVQTAQGELNTALANLRNATLTVKNDVSSSYLELESDEQRISVANDEVVNAQEGVRIAEGRYSAGLGLFQDIITAQGFLVSAQSDQANAVSALNEARARLRHAVGEVFN
jgi:outer membrane protein